MADRAVFVLVRGKDTPFTIEASNSNLNQLKELVKVNGILSGIDAKDLVISKVSMAAAIVALRPSCSLTNRCPLILRIPLPDACRC